MEEPRQHQAHHREKGHRDVIMTERSKHATLCNAAITVGPDWKSFVLTQLLVLLPIGLFFGWVIVDMDDDELPPVIVISLAVLCAFTFIALLLTGLKNPGVIKRHSPRATPDLRTWTREVNGHEVTTKYCPTCRLYRPPRCSHCAVCDGCIEKFDHHCPWVGTCIGRRNYQPYLAFIYGASLTCIYFLVVCVLRVIKLANRDNVGESILREWALLAMILYSILALIFVGALSGFHTYLLSTNQTTYEYFRHRGPAGSNPFDRTLFHNCHEALCGATGLYRFREDDGPMAPPRRAQSYALN